MDFYYDLHIHTGLSPCANNSMTPNNIVNMAFIKGIDIISITDHNSYLNVQATVDVGKMRSILVIPGMEVTSKEDIHLLCYFEDIPSLKRFGDRIYKTIPNVKNVKELFGRQFIFNSEDQIIGEVERLLINASSFSLNEIYNMVLKERGVMIPAHVDKKSYSILSVLGFIPKNLGFKFLEIWDKKYKNKLTEDYKGIYNSDAHSLEDISEPINKLKIKEKSIQEVLKYLKLEGRY